MSRLVEAKKVFYLLVISLAKYGELKQLIG